MNTDQFIESLDASNIMHIRKLAPALGNLCSSSESIAGSPDNDLSISWDGSCRQIIFWQLTTNSLNPYSQFVPLTIDWRVLHKSQIMTFTPLHCDQSHNVTKIAHYFTKLSKIISLQSGSLYFLMVIQNDRFKYSRHTINYIAIKISVSKFI